MVQNRRVVFSATRTTFAVTAVVFALLSLSGCEGVFTTSLLSFMQRDPANLSPSQQVQYGEDALASGDPAAMASAYEVLKDSTDPETQLLAADLALGAVELESAVAAAVAGIAAGDDTETTLEEVLAGFSAEDLAMMEEAAALVDAADATATPTPEQYAFAAIGLLAVAASDAGGDIASIPANSPDLGQATSFLNAAVAQLQASGESTDLLDANGILGAIPVYTP
jgi:hypothetical protein